jgi:hypothetical protein
MDIREVTLDWNGEELEKASIDSVSMVDQPAIQMGFMYFNEATLEVEEVTCLHENVLTDEMKETILKFADEHGEAADDTWQWINNSFFADATQTDIIDVLKSLQDKNVLDAGEVKYRYTGPPVQRDFCKALLLKNKLFTEAEIELLNGLNPGFGIGGSNNYDVREFRGGVGCLHVWNAVKVFRDSNTGRTVAYDMGKANWSQPPVGYYNSKFSMVEDQQIVVGPALIPNKLIRRFEDVKLPDGTIQKKEFFVYFSVDTVEKLAAKFLAQNKLHNTNINHDPTTNTTRNTMLSSWIVVDPSMDASKAYGYDVPSGTWMLSYRVNDPKTWQMVKAGKLTGFSIEGNLMYQKVDTSDGAKLWNELFNILGQIED